MSKEMNLISNNKVERSLVQLGEFELVRIKNYDSKSGLTSISWRFKEDGSVVQDGYATKLEKKYIRNTRNVAFISK